MIDMYTDEPLLNELIEKIVWHYLKIVEKYVEMGVDVMHMPDDLGMQNSLVLSVPKCSENGYYHHTKLFKPCKDNKYSHRIP